MGFMKRLKDIASGRIARNNQIIGNHGVRICEKLKTHANPLLEILVRETAICTIQFLEAALFDVEDFKYNDGTVEPNPFKENLDRLDAKSSYEMFKLVAGNFLIALFAEGIFRDDETRIDIPELRDQFFNIYDYNDEDRQIFYELLKLAQNDLLGDGKEKGLPYQGVQLYDYIFKRAYNINPPEYVYQLMNFTLHLKETGNKIFIPEFVEGIKELYKKRLSTDEITSKLRIDKNQTKIAIGDFKEPEDNKEASTSENDDDFTTRILCSDGTCIGVVGEDGYCKECGKKMNVDGGRSQEYK
jgi:hypothetical protein